MPTFQDSQQLYDTLGAFLTSIVNDDPELKPKFVAADTSLQVTYTDPPAVIYVDTRCDPPVVRFGEEGDADISLTMAADDGHQFWLGDLNMPMALAKGKVKVQGSVAKIMRLLPAMRPAFPKYREFLVANGHESLVG